MGSHRHWIALALSLLVGGVAHAELCAIDDVPAATLLFPSFEVEVGDCESSGLDTLITISNAAPETTIAHVTLWSDWSVPVLYFDIYLTGFDIQALSLRNVLCGGLLPSTGFAVSAHGSSSEAPTEFPFCTESEIPGDPPNYDNPALPSILLEHLQAWLTGQESPSSGTCAGRSLGDTVARGYVTVDVARDCSLESPADPGYFADDGVAGFDNVLVGEWRRVDAATGLVLGPMPAVHLEADTAGQVFVPGDTTFYGRYVGGDASDRREPLPTSWLVRTEDAGSFGTDLIVWRENAASTASPVACGLEPTGIPLDAATAVYFDEEENPFQATESFPDELGRVPVALTANPYGFGMADLDLADSGAVPIYGNDRAQAWVGAIRTLVGFGSGVIPGIPLDSNCSGSVIVANVVFADGFEGGNTSAW